MNAAQSYLRLLGMRGRDKVTGFEGVITSVGFDLYGCIQFILNPGADKDGKLREQVWFDTNRVEITDPMRVMPVPDFPEFNTASNKEKGGEVKPIPSR